MGPIDDPRRVDQIRRKIKRKVSLQHFYSEMYQKYQSCIARCPSYSLTLELGSGAGFAKEIFPQMITSDVIPYSGIDCVVDGQALPFKNDSLGFIGMINVFHHVPNVEQLLSEIQRCLIPRGRALIIDQHPGVVGAFLYRYLHYEHYNPDAEQWSFASSGPLSGANGALAWMVFVRDRAVFSAKFPSLVLDSYKPHTPLFYWLSGGLKWWNLIPSWGIRAIRAIDTALIARSDNWGSFVDIELVRRDV